MGLFLLTVKRDTQKERATKSRNSWGAEAVRVRATGSLRAHPPEVLGRNFSLGFLVNSETRHTEGASNQFFGLSSSQSNEHAGGANNQISEELGSYAVSRKRPISKISDFQISTSIFIHIRSENSHFTVLPRTPLLELLNVNL